MNQKVYATGEAIDMLSHPGQSQDEDLEKFPEKQISTHRNEIGRNTRPEILC